MTASPSPKQRRVQYARGFMEFGQGEVREKHLGRKLRREWQNERRSEESLTRWAWALNLSPVSVGLSGWYPRDWDEDRRDAEEREASQALALQKGRARALTHWYAAQVRRGRSVTTAELVARLGAWSEKHGAELLEAWAFDLFHLHRHLWRALKRQQAQEAGLTGADAYAQVQREEAHLEALTVRPALPERPSRVKRPRPVEYRPQVQPNAPTN